MTDLSGFIRKDDPRLADFTPEEIARGVPDQVKQTPAEILAEQNAARLGEVAGAADVAGSFVTGEEQVRVDEILAGVQSGKYSAEDALSALSAIETVGRARFDDDTDEDPDEDPPIEDPAITLARQQQAQGRTDAFSSLRALLSRVGLSELEGAVQDIITSGRVNIEDPNAIMFALREQPAYQRRFAANKKRIELGLPELSPETYIGLEEQYRQILASNGLPIGFYNDQTDFEKFIEGDVSPAELQSRIRDGYAKVMDADPAVVQQMRELYGVSQGDLAAYFIDPERTRPLLTASDYRRQAQAAAISARGLEQGGLQLTGASAEDLVRRGITPEQAGARFAERARLSGLFQEMTGEQALTEEQKLGATFGYDVASQEELERRRAQRVGQFQGGGQFARTTGATSGTIETGLGMAQ